MHEFIVFIRNLFRMIFFVRGVLLALLLVLLIFALITSKMDDVSFLDALYLAFITALTVGYGDITPVTGISRAIGVLTGLVGVIFMGLVVAVSTRALEIAVEEEKRFQRGKLKSDKER